ncbi:MAG: ATP-binding cassette domain-containing protein, partial [Pannonibacter indicus]
AAAYHDKAGAQAAAAHLALLPMAEEDAATTPAQPAVTPPAGPVAVTFRSATLGHENRPVLAGLNLDLRPGELLHLRGPSGSGKSTLMDALIGLNPPLSGEILISGTPLSALDQGLWRSRIAWLSQDPRLFFGSVRANLRRAALDATDADIWAALELAGARSLVEQMPRGLSTSLGEDGFGLSVGEARRIALARAMLRPDPLLVLADEPTAGLDEDTAAVVIAGLQVLCRGRSALIASHDPVLLALPGRVFDLEPQSLPEVAE